MDRLHRVQNRFYAGEDVDDELRGMHTQDVIWIVPGTNDIAGEYEGVEQVLSSRTVGLYRVRSERVSACWLLPLDSDTFDRIWTGDA